MKKTTAADSLLVLVLASLLIAPLFRLNYMNNWGSIESTFIADARMLNENLPHPGWQPLWYCGTRFDYIYPPALRYGTAILAKVARLTTARAYHLYTAIFYVLGILAVYWLALIGTRQRIWALLAASGTALLSPSFLFLTQIRHDSGDWVPQRLHVLALWGEGPHISALSILPAALAVSFLALRKWTPAAFAAASCLSALVVANNFYGATSLAIFFPIVVFAVWNGERNVGVWIRAAAIVGFAYCLSAFWLTPSYIRVTIEDLKLVSQPGNVSSAIALIVVVALYCAGSMLVAGRRREREWPVFVTGAAVIFSLYVLGMFFFGFRVAGEAGRLIPELDMVLILGLLEFMRAAWRRPPLRSGVVVLVVLAFFPAVRYLTHAWTPFPKSGALETQYPWQITKWVNDHLPGERVLPSGEVRFWYDAWFDNAQPDGGSMQGILNPILPEATWQILAGTRADLATLWLQALGTDAVIVPDRTSLEIYNTDYANPAKFRDILPILFDNRHGTVVYRIPRVHSGIGRVVDKETLGKIGKIRGGDDLETLTKYISVVENPDQPVASVAWHGFDEVDIRNTTSTGQSVLLQETFDPAWRAWDNGRPVAIRPEPTMNFMLIDVPEGDHAIQMRFRTPAENRAGQLLTAVSLLTALGLMLPLRKLWVARNSAWPGPEPVS